MSNFRNNLQLNAQKAIKFITIGVWELPLKQMSKSRRIGINIIKVIILAFKGFKKSECSIRASALTYFTLLSIVPVIAVAFAISKGFGLDQVLEEEITNTFASQQEVMTYVLEFSKKMLSSTKGGLLAVISIGFLLYTVLKLFHHIESAVNITWNIKKARTLLRKFTDYLSIVILAPILMIGSSAVTVYINTTIKALAKGAMFEMISPLLIILMQSIPFVIVWMLFSLMYIVMPNTKVKFGRAFIASMIAGSIFQLIQIYYIDVQFAFSRYNTVYGSFAALPLFLIWVQLSWLIFLFGAEMSVALDKVKTYGKKLDYDLLSYSRKRLLNFLVLKKIVEYFKNGEKAPTVEQLSVSLKLPIMYIEQITYDLISADLINEILSQNDEDNTFQPSKDLSLLSFADVFQIIENMGHNRLIVNDSPEFNKMNEQFDEFYSGINKNYSHLLIKDI